MYYGSTLKFSDADLELEYISANVRSSANKMKTIFLYAASFFFLLALLEAVVVSPVGHSSVAGNGLAFCAFLCAHKLPKTKWYLIGNNSERGIVFLGVIVAFSLAFGHSAATYYDSAFYTGSTEKSSRGALSSELGFYYFMNGVWPVVLCHLYMYFDVVRFVAFGSLLAGVVLFHAIRTIIINPVPGDMRLMWVLINYIALPGFFLLLARSNELQRREVFLFNRSILLKKRRRRSTAVHGEEVTAARFCKLPVVVFEKPTDGERLIVANTFDAPDMSWLAPYQVWFEDIVFHTRIGTGQFGEAILSSFHGARCVAKRMLRKSIDEDSLRLVVNEARAVANLRHPNVVQFLGISWDNVANILLLFEYVPRGDLTGVLRDKQVFLSWDDPKLSMAIDVGRGLGYLHHGHTSPVVHGDMKPDNVLVTNTFGCKLSDFGSAKLGERNSVTTSSRFFGTALYMAPEIFLDGAYSTAVDVFSFGVLLWELQSHFRPYEDLHVGVEELLHKTAVEQLRPPVDPTMPPELRSLMQRCWAHDADERPDMSKVVQELEEIQRAEWELHSHRRALSQERHGGYPGRDMSGLQSSSAFSAEEEKKTDTQSHFRDGLDAGPDGGGGVECETIQEEVPGARQMMFGGGSSSKSPSGCWVDGAGDGDDVEELNSPTMLDCGIVSFGVEEEDPAEEVMDNDRTTQLHPSSVAPSDRAGLLTTAGCCLMTPSATSLELAPGKSPAADQLKDHSFLESHHLAPSDRRGLLTTGCCLMTPSATTAGTTTLPKNITNTFVDASSGKKKNAGGREARTWSDERKVHG